MRIDAEFFKKEYLFIDSYLRNKPFKDLGDIGIKIFHPKEIIRSYVDFEGIIFYEHKMLDL